MLLAFLFIAGEQGPQGAFIALLGDLVGQSTLAASTRSFQESNANSRHVLEKGTFLRSLDCCDQYIC